MTARMKELRTEIQIDASPQRVWEALTESGDWGAWNPFVRRVIGDFREGARLENTMVLEGQKPMTFKPKVLRVDPARELRWLGRLLIPGLFDGEHYFQLEPAGAGTRFVHGEIFRGLLIGMLDFAKTEAAFRALNEGLKRKAEGAPTS
jgi:hypothetical protein